MAGSTGSLRSSSGLVYLAAPIVTFGTERYRHARDVLLSVVPENRVLEAASAFRDTDEWRKHWPGIVRSLGHLVFIADDANAIGAGVFQEVLDAQFRRVPVSYLDDRGAFHEIGRIAFRMLAGGDPYRFASVQGRSARRGR